MRVQSTPRANRVLLPAFSNHPVRSRVVITIDNMKAARAVKRIIPLLDRVLIEKAVAEKTSSGGVLLPESAISKLNEGKVIAVGAGARTSDGTLIAPVVKEGDNVLLPEYGGSKVVVDGKDLFLYRDDDLLGLIQ